MLRRFRQILTVVAFAVCLTVSLAAAVAVLRQGASRSAPPELLPRPTIAGPGVPAVRTTPDQELRLLVSQDLARTPRDEQLAAAVRLEQLIRTRPDWRPDQRLTAEQLGRLQDNVIELVRVWFLWKADQFAGLKGYEQEPFLDDLLGLADALLAMAPAAGDIGAMKAKPSAFAGRPNAAGPAFLRLLGRLQERVTPEEQAKAVSLGLALHERWQLRAKKPEGKATTARP